MLDTGYSKFIISICVMGIILCGFAISYVSKATSQSEYLESVIPEDHIIIKNTVTDTNKDYFIIDENDNVSLLLIDTNGKIAPRKDDYSHTLTEVDESNDLLMDMFEISMIYGR